jgi:Tol biopolymer transport system component
MTVDPQSGAMINTEQLIEGGTGTGGRYSWWGTRFDWSPDGQQLAWIHADAVGTVNLATGELNPPIFEYESVAVLTDWSWRTSVSWSLDGNILAATVHGPPAGSESAERSVVFNVAVGAINGEFEGDLVGRAGIWSVPQFSPQLPSDGQFAKGHIAYMVARQPLNSVGSEYDLYVADQDGSNARRLFPDANRAGITPPNNAISPQYVWSPDGKQLVVVYQGNLWLVDVETGAALQLTLDGNASYPVWGS